MATAGSKTPPVGIMTGRDSPRGAGSKTPRKVVQWMDTHEEGPEDSTHALDEHGRDPNAFETLTTALERHQSGTPSTPRIHYFPPQRPAGLPRISTNYPPSHLSAATTASSDGEHSAPPSPTHAVPGNYIGPQERAGLPGTSDLEDYSRRAATKVVRAHTRKGFFGGRLNLRKQKSARADDYFPAHHRADNDDVEQALSEGAPMNPALGGGGVLSALLTLYNDAEPGSLASTPGTEEAEPTWPAPLPPLPPPAKKASPSQIEEVPRHDASGSSSTLPSPSRDPIGRTHARSGSQASIASKFRLPLPLLPQNPRARNGGGVVGALIASTGNIAGAAAPGPSTLAPNIKRPGYHLSRYSLDDADVPQVAPKRERPRSMPPLPPEPQPTQPSPTLRGSSTMPSIAGTNTSTNTTTARNSSTGTTNTNTARNSTGGTPSLASKRGWTEKLRGMEHAMAFAASGGRSGRSTPVQTPSSGTDREQEQDEWIEEKWLREQETRREKRRKRKKAEVYITRHVAQVIQRQEFILKLTRALMMFGGPSHRLQAQIQATGRVLDIQVNCMYLPDVVLISFDDSSTGTSNLKFIRQGSALELGKLNETYALYWSVIHDEQSVSEASSTLDALMRKKQEYTWWQLVLTGGMCSASICSVGFNGSFIDSLIVFPLGALLVAIQLLSVRNELYSNVFEITVATLFSFISAALASSGVFCYSAVASSSVVLILPGFIVLCGSLEIMSRNIVSGSVRMCYAVVYSLFLGFGLAIGAEAYEKITSHTIVGSTDYACSISHDPGGPWWQQTPKLWWAFLTVPTYSLFLSMRNHAPWRNRDMVLLVVISCIGWVTNHFTGIKFVGQSDISAAVGAFAVGVVANVYARFFSGNAFVIMITGILFQLPSGLGNGGLLTYASEKTAGNSSSYLSGFQTALLLISVAIGLTVGLGLALAIVHPIQSRRRAGGVFSL
ncbi:hypothetical protein C8R47DRAFT_1228304 [Mycena vitilis]|nr:hypothetical protein C8R47DRAFT_1228304 [Mycena vitilis]